jgi:hypothetical protein
MCPLQNPGVAKVVVLGGAAFECLRVGLDVLVKGLAEKAITPFSLVFFHVRTQHLSSPEKTVLTRL